MIINLAAAFAATLTFAMIFFAPRRLYVVCAVGGVVSWGVYQALAIPLGPIPATFAAAFALTVYARLCGILFKAPAIIFIVVGIFPLAPGAAIYNMAYALFAGDLSAASSYGLSALTTAGAIALGMLFGHTPRIAILHRRKKPVD